MSPLPAEQLAAQKRSARDKRKFVKVTHGGSSCVCTPVEAAAILSESEHPDEYSAIDVWMTQHAFEELPDFGGW